MFFYFLSKRTTVHICQVADYVAGFHSSCQPGYAAEPTDVATLS